MSDSNKLIISEEDAIKNKAMLSDEELEQATGGGIIDDIGDGISNVANTIAGCKKRYIEIICMFCKNFEESYEQRGEEGYHVYNCKSKHFKTVQVRATGR